nr:MAG TPA: hypothetical protein [Caudoviricetes sp.]
MLIDQKKSYKITNYHGVKGDFMLFYQVPYKPSIASLAY